MGSRTQPQGKASPKAALVHARYQLGSSHPQGSGGHLPYSFGYFGKLHEVVLLQELNGWHVTLRQRGNFQSKSHFLLDGIIQQNVYPRIKF